MVKDNNGEQPFKKTKQYKNNSNEEEVNDDSYYHEDISTYTKLHNDELNNKKE